MTILKIGTVVAAIGLVALVSCTEEAPVYSSSEPTFAETDDINAFATSVLNDLQPVSIAESRGWSITRFYQPKVTGSRRREKCQRMKSINQEFVSYIKLGLQFMEDFEKYHNDSFEIGSASCRERV